jgi:hypothetical protein
MAIEYSHSNQVSDSEDLSNNHRIDGMSSDDEDSSDTSSVLTEVSCDDFPSYFLEVNGRLYSSSISHGNRYPLPVDTLEQEVRSSTSQ